MMKNIRRAGLLWALVLAFTASGAVANHKNGVCAMPDEIFAKISAGVPASLNMIRLDQADALQYVDLLFKLTGGGLPPFDLSKIKGGVVIYSPHYPKVYAGVADGPNGEICHAAAIDAALSKAILAEIAKGKS